MNDPTDKSVDYLTTGLASTNRAGGKVLSDCQINSGPVSNFASSPTLPKVIYIWRGRNTKAGIVGRWLTQSDYNFDYRGGNIFALLLKAWITSTEIPKADIYVAEGGLCHWVANFLKRRYKGAKLVLIVLEPAFYVEHKVGLLASLKTWMRYRMYRQNIDAVIAVSEMVAADAREVLRCPVYVAHHFIVKPERFMTLSPDLSRKRIVFIIERPLETGFVKGLDIAVAAFRLLREKHSDAELWLVGSGTEHLDYRTEGIRYLGFQDVERVYEQCSVLLAPARYEAFGIAVLEACVAGLIPIVSFKTGAKEVLEPVDPSLIVHSQEPAAFARRIDELWTRPPAEHRAISERLRRAALYFNEENCKAEHVAVWSSINPAAPIAE